MPASFYYSPKTNLNYEKNLWIITINYYAKLSYIENYLKREGSVFLILFLNAATKASG